MSDPFIDYGDFIEHRLNTDVFGIVIGRSGSVISVRLSPSLTVASYHECELRLAEDEEYHGPEADEADNNVIDFTKERALRADTKTKGAA